MTPTLSSSGAIHGALFGGQSLHEPWQQVVEAGFAHSLHHGAQGFS